MYMIVPLIASARH